MEKVEKNGEWIFTKKLKKIEEIWKIVVLVIYTKIKRKEN